MADVVYIARCPEHGLHGERPECFVCGGEVAQVPMVQYAEHHEALTIMADVWQAQIAELEAGRDRLRDDLAVLKARPDCSAPLLGLLHERDRYGDALQAIRDELAYGSPVNWKHIEKVLTEALGG